MTDLYLKFDDEGIANSVLYRVEQIPQPDGSTASVMVRKYRDTDVIGTMYQPITDPFADPLPPPVAIPGWHVNVYLRDGEDAAPLMPYAIQPANPRRVRAQ